MLPVNFVKNKIITTIIAPHGITDLIHGTQTNSMKELLSINSICLFLSVASSTNKDAEIIFDALFFTGSIIHFHHDYKSISFGDERIQYFLCLSSFLAFLVNIDLFYIYMVFCHVPNHYRMNWQHINQNKQINILFILSFVFASDILIGDIFVKSHMTYDCFKGLVMAHIIYQELYVLNE